MALEGNYHTITLKRVYDKMKPAEIIREKTRQLKADIQELCGNYASDTGLAIVNIYVDFHQFTVIGTPKHTIIKSVRVTTEEV